MTVNGGTITKIVTASVGTLLAAGYPTSGAVSYAAIIALG